MGNSHSTISRIGDKMRAIVSTCQDCKETFQSKRQLTEHAKERSCSEKKGNDEVIMLDDDGDNSSKSHVDDYVSNNVDLVQDEEDLQMKYDDQEDDEIEVVKSNIYKYQGNLNYKQTVANDVFQFSYQDDEDDIIMLDSEPEDEESSETNQTEEFNHIVQENINLTFETKMSECTVCQKSLFESNLEEHLNTAHPIKNRELKEFSGGFFLISS